jgi:thiosulfate reductase cytochrome b subunit
MSGLQIFNAHPALYWGEASTFEHPLLDIGRFPGWITIPSYQDLATGRVWHFFFAWLLVLNGLGYLVYSIASRHLSRDLVPTGAQLAAIGRSVRDHLRGAFYAQAHAEYNPLQKLSYLLVVLALLPLMVLTGLTMSPAIDAAAPWLLHVLGGRQSARTIHFATGGAVVLFVLVHVAMVVLSGFANNIRSMITGWYALDRKPARHGDE